MSLSHMTSTGQHHDPFLRCFPYTAVSSASES